MITKKQKQVLKAINDFITNNNYSPSVRELATALNLKSTSTMQGYTCF
jgi:repressor LexA